MIALSWTAPFDEDTTRTVAGYDIRFSGLPLTPANFDGAAAFDHPPDPAPPGTVQNASFGGLLDGRTYYVALRSRDEAGNISSMSNVARISTPVGPDLIPPAAITDLAVKSATSFTVTLTWTAPGDDSTDGRATGYDLRTMAEPITPSNWSEADSLDAPEPSLPGTTESFKVAGLTPGTTRYYAIRAVDDAGNSGNVSNSVSAITAPITVWRIKADGTGDAPTIQAGIDSAKDENVVLVEPGRYFESIDFKGKAITVKSEMGPEVTVIDGKNKAAPVVSFLSGEDRSSVIEGFTITNGLGDPILGGGGVLASEAGPTISSNIITGNRAAGHGVEPDRAWGGGILVRAVDDVEMHPLIINNRIVENVAGDNGGGIGIHDGVSAEIVSNNIENNTCLTGDGGGIWILTIAERNSVRNNRISSNAAGDHGGGIYFGSLLRRPLSVDILFNVIWDNHANHSSGSASLDTGGGVWLNRVDAEVANNTIVGNSGTGGESDYGGGVSIELEGTTAIRRNMIAFSLEGGGILCHSGAYPEISNNIFWANEGGDLVGDCNQLVGEDGNVSTDPLFCAPLEGDFRLQSDSPALNHPAGLIGAVSTIGCSPILTERGPRERRSKTTGISSDLEKK